jgi:hypothetical protein
MAFLDPCLFHFQGLCLKGQTMMHPLADAVEYDCGDNSLTPADAAASTAIATPALRRQMELAVSDREKP